MQSQASKKSGAKSGVGSHNVSTRHGPLAAPAACYSLALRQQHSRLPRVGQVMQRGMRVHGRGGGERDAGNHE